MGWPTDWDERISGASCSLCAEERADELPRGLRILASPVADAYLARRALVRGYVVVVWRGRHVTELHHLDADEATLYQADVLRVGQALDDHYAPLKVNYMTLGNIVPHLHTHVTARYRDDPAPGAPLPAVQNPLLPSSQFEADAAALRERLSGSERAGLS